MFTENIELKNLLESAVTNNTKKTYQTSYNKLMKTGEFMDTNITETDNLEIIEIVKNITENPNTRKAYIIVVIKIKRNAGKPVTELEHFIQQNKGKIMEHIQEKKLTANPLNETINSFKEYVQQLYDAGLWVPYIINYLILNYGVRNLDLDLLVVNNKNKKNIGNTLDNYLIVYKSKIVYLRRKFKTYKTYGEKINVINDKQFIDAVEKLNRNDYEPLLLTNAGTRITEDGARKTIQRMTYKKYGEGRLFKLLVDDAKYNEEKLKELSDNRGTSISEIMASYTNENLLK